jgi:acyl carrier protein
MEKILINWLTKYTGIEITTITTFDDLKFDVLDEAVVTDFVQKQFNVNVNKKNIWFDTVKDLIDAISAGT